MTSRSRSAKSKVTSRESVATPARLSAGGRSSERGRRICYAPKGNIGCVGPLCAYRSPAAGLSSLRPRPHSVAAGWIRGERCRPPLPPWRRPPPRTVGGRDGGRCPPSVARLGRAPSGGGGRHTEFGGSVSGLRKARQLPNRTSCILARKLLLKSLLK